MVAKRIKLQATVLRFLSESVSSGSCFVLHPTDSGDHRFHLRAYAAMATCHILIAKRRIAATTAIFLCLGLRATMRA